MWLKPLHFRFYKIEESATCVGYSDVSRSYFIWIEDDDAEPAVDVDFVLPARIEHFSEMLRKWEIAREIHKEFLRLYNLGEDILAERPKSFDLTIKILAED